MKFCVATVLVCALAAGQTAPQSQPARRQTFTSSATAILVDVVVRDNAGRPITDLSAPDFQILEDGVPQHVDSFTRVSRGGGIGVGVAWRSPDRILSVRPTESAPAPSGAADGQGEDQGTIALIFDHLPPEALRQAQKATLDYVPMSGDSPTRIGVFATVPSVRVLQRYTTDRSAVRRAVSEIVAGDVSYQEETADRSDDLIERRRQIEGSTQSAEVGAIGGFSQALARNAADAGQLENERKLVQTELNMIRSYENFERSDKGYDTTLALLAVIQTLSDYPGRKTIVLFSEGLPVSPALSAKLDYVIDAANRANVTAYAVDAKGLRTHSSLEATRKELQTFADERAVQTGVGTDRTEQPLAMSFERVEDTLKLDSRVGLARLAQDTGGFLVEDTNNLTSAFKRIDEDNQFHYLLTYAPKNPAFDGKFRAIHVDVRRPGAHVFARKGYRALHAAPGASAENFETPALALLDSSPLPNAFPVHAAGFSFPDPARPGLAPIVVHLATSSLLFSIDRARSTYSAQAAVVVRIRDAEGHQVQTLSQQYVLSGDAKDVEAAKKGEILFYREPDLRPGVYTLETIVFDAAAQRGSARLATLTVPAVNKDQSQLGMSSLVLVNRAEEVAAGDGRAGAPFFVGRTLLYPNVGDPIQNAPSRDLPFYFALYGHVRSATASAQLLRNGQVLAEAPVQLRGSGDALIQEVGRIPVGSLPAGTYQLRIRVTNGSHELSRAAFFTLQ